MSERPSTRELNASILPDIKAMSALISSVLKLSKLVERLKKSAHRLLISSRVANGISTVLPEMSVDIMPLICLEQVVLKVALTTRRLLRSAVCTCFAEYSPKCPPCGPARHSAAVSATSSAVPALSPRFLSLALLTTGFSTICSVRSSHCQEVVAPSWPSRVRVGVMTIAARPWLARLFLTS